MIVGFEEVEFDAWESNVNADDIYWGMDSSGSDIIGETTEEEFEGYVEFVNQYLTWKSCNKVPFVWGQG